jgi:hypothetical protein
MTLSASRDHDMSHQVVSVGLIKPGEKLQNKNDRNWSESYLVAKDWKQQQLLLTCLLGYLMKPSASRDLVVSACIVSVST